MLYINQTYACYPRLDMINSSVMLKALDDIEVAMKIIRRRTSNENPIDTHYKDLKCDLEPLDHTHADFKVCCRVQVGIIDCVV